jgi:large conductance mechanosensitive channel
VIKEFKTFIMKGNLVELAVAFILGVAFASVVTAFTNVILGTIAWVSGGHASFDQSGVHKGTSPAIVIPYGAFLTQVLNFLIVGLVLFFIVRAYNRMKVKKPEEPTTRECPFCKTQIPNAATRCPACTSDVAAVA